MIKMLPVTTSSRRLPRQLLEKLRSLPSFVPQKLACEPRLALAPTGPFRAQLAHLVLCFLLIEIAHPLLVCNRLALGWERLVVDMTKLFHTLDPLAGSKESRHHGAAERPMHQVEAVANLRINGKKTYR